MLSGYLDQSMRSKVGGGIISISVHTSTQTNARRRRMIENKARGPQPAAGLMRRVTLIDMRQCLLFVAVGPPMV